MASRALAALSIHLLASGAVGRRSQEELEFPTSAIRAAGAAIGAVSPYAEPGASRPKTVGLHVHAPGEMHDDGPPKVRLQGAGTYLDDSFTDRTAPFNWDSTELLYARHRANNPKEKERKKVLDINAEAEKQGRDEPKAAEEPFKKKAPTRPQPKAESTSPAAKQKEKVEAKGAEKPKATDPLDREPTSTGGADRPWSSAPWSAPTKGSVAAGRRSYAPWSKKGQNKR